MCLLYHPVFFLSSKPPEKKIPDLPLSNHNTNIFFYCYNVQRNDNRKSAKFKTKNPQANFCLSWFTTLVGTGHDGSASQLFNLSTLESLYLTFIQQFLQTCRQDFHQGQPGLLKKLVSKFGAVSLVKNCPSQVSTWQVLVHPHPIITKTIQITDLHLLYLSVIQDV